MSGIYIHIPFCKQACSYCNFHFSTKMVSKAAMIQALSKELTLRKGTLEEAVITSVYFGGGTPSVLSAKEITSLLTVVFKHYKVADTAEITLEANPDDLSKPYLESLSKTRVNRLSIGIQSFNEAHLTFMNRAHTANQSLAALQWAQQYFNNFSIDLIYGVPPAALVKKGGRTPTNASFAIWEKDVALALGFNPKHIAAYALTIEPKTALDYQIKKGAFPPLEDAVAHREFEYLKSQLIAYGYLHYEFSNFSKPNFHSVNNTGYWEGSQYMGVGPSAHSYDGESRSWNVANNPLYIKAIAKGNLPATKEVLGNADRYNEFIMTGLRTAKGVSLQKIAQRFGKKFARYALQEASKKIKDGSLVLGTNQVLKVAPQAQFLTDGLAAQLFYIEDA